MIRFEKSLVEGITEIKRPTEFSFRNYSIYNLELARISRFNFENTELSTCEKKKKERKKKRSEMKSKMLLASIILDSSTIICTDLRQFSTLSRTINLFREDVHIKTHGMCTYNLMA